MSFEREKNANFNIIQLYTTQESDQWIIKEMDIILAINLQYMVQKSLIVSHGSIKGVASALSYNTEWHT